MREYRARYVHRKFLVSANVPFGGERVCARARARSIANIAKYFPAKRHSIRAIKLDTHFSYYNKSKSERSQRTKQVSNLLNGASSCVCAPVFE